MDLRIENIDFGYNGGNILSSLNLHVKQNEFVSLLGLSGCGKSTLLNLVAGFLTPLKGKIFFGDEEVKSPNNERAMVFQEDAVFPWYNVFENVAYPFKVQKEKININLIEKILDDVGLKDFQYYLPKELSGGMKKRVDLARAYAASPQLLLMDEPFGSLDSYTRHKMQMLLLKLWTDNKTTVLFVTHDISEALFLSDRIILMDSEKGNIRKEFKLNFPHPRNRDLKKKDLFLQLLEKIENELNLIENE